MMAHFEMKAMEKFPIEKLSYDLKLELLEKMDPSDVVQLVNVNQGFRSIVLREPWRIVGKHVDTIWIYDETNFGIDKFQSGISMDDDRLAIRRAGEDPCKPASHYMALETGLILFSKIRSCQKLDLPLTTGHLGQEAALLRSLASVGELYIYINSPEAKIEEFLPILTLNHIDSAYLFIGYIKKDEQKRRVWSNFVETNLNHCKRIEICECSPDSFWYDPLSKIWSEMIVFQMPSLYNDLESGSLVHRIVTKGIPSSNPEAAILLSDYWCAEPADSVVGLLSRTPGICEIADKGRGELQEILEKMFLDGLFSGSHGFCVDSFRNFLRQGAYFARPIDSKRKCIFVTGSYVVETKYSNRFFLTKYITII